MADPDAEALELKPLAKQLQQDCNLFRALWLCNLPLRPSPLLYVERYMRRCCGIDPHVGHAARYPKPQAVYEALTTAHEFLQKNKSQHAAKPKLQTLLDIAGFDLGYHQSFSALILLKSLKSMNAAQRQALIDIFKIYEQPRQVHLPPAVAPLKVVSAFPEQRIYPASQNLMQVFYSVAAEKNSQVHVDLAEALKVQGGNPFKLKFLGQVPPGFHVVNFVKRFVRQHVSTLYSNPRLAKRKNLPPADQCAKAFHEAYEWIQNNIAGRRPDLEIWFNIACFDLGFNDVMTAQAFANYLVAMSHQDRDTFLNNLDRYPLAAPI